MVVKRIVLSSCLVAIGFSIGVLVTLKAVGFS